MRHGKGLWFRNVSDYSKGMITSMPRGDAPIGSFLKAMNVDFASGSIKRRYGMTYLDSDVGAVPADIHGLYQYTRQYNAVGGGIAYYRCYIFAAGTTLYLWDGEGDPDLWDITISLGTSLSSDDIYACTYLDFMYITNGYEIIKTDATKLGTRLITLASTIATPAPIGVALAAGTLSGYRSYKYRYVRSVDDLVTNTSDFSTAVQSPLMANNYTRVTYTASANPLCTHIEIWSTITYLIAGVPPTIYYRIATTPNVNGSLTDGATDAQIREAYTEDTTNQNMGRFDGLNKLIVYKDRMYGVREDFDASIVWYSELGNPDLWLDASWIDFNRDDGDIITGFAVRGNTLYVFKQHGLYSMTGDPVAVPMIQREAVASSINQSSLGVGCTSPRSIATYEGDIYFYSSIHGVWKISGAGITPLSNDILTEIRGIDNAAGGIYVDPKDGHNYYVLSQPLRYSGDEQDEDRTVIEASTYTWRCDLLTGAWRYDTNINVECFLSDHRGYLLGNKAGYITRYYDPDVTYDIDRDHEIDLLVRMGWITLQDGHEIGVPRKLVMVGADKSGFYTIQLYNEKDEHSYSNIVAPSDEAEIDLVGEPSRLCSYAIAWQSGEIEDMILRFLKQPLRE